MCWGLKAGWACMSQHGCAVGDHLAGGPHLSSVWRCRKSLWQRMGLGSLSVMVFTDPAEAPNSSTGRTPGEPQTCSLTPQSRNLIRHTFKRRWLDSDCGS